MKGIHIDKQEFMYWCRRALTDRTAMEHDPEFVRWSVANKAWFFDPCNRAQERAWRAEVKHQIKLDIRS